MAFFLLGEPVTISLFFGTLLVVTGVLLTNNAQPPDRFWGLMRDRISVNKSRGGG